MVFTLPLLKEVLMSPSESRFSTSLLNLQDQTDFSIASCFVSGRADSDAPILSKSLKIALACNRVIKESIFSNCSTDSRGNMNLLHKESISRSLSLLGPKHSSMKVENLFGVDFSDALNLIETNTKIRTLSFFERILSSILLFVKLIQSISNLGKGSCGIKVGTRTQEKGVILGQMVTMFGQAFLDKKTGEIKMFNPEYILKEKGQLIERVRQRCIFNSSSVSLFAIITSALGFLIARRIYRLIREVMNSRARRLLNQKKDRLEGISEVVGDLQCSCCKKEMCNTIIKPCFHIVLCSNCSKNRDKSLGCPRCKTKVEETVKIFVS